MGDAAANIAKALSLKQQGNELFRAGEYRKAMVPYHEIYMYVHGFSEGDGKSHAAPGSTTAPATAEQMRCIQELKLAHFSNLAMCHLKLGNVEKARDNCTKALAIAPHNIKCLFRRGKCYSQLGALDEAKEDLTQVLAVDPENRDALREMQMLRQRFASHKKKEQKKFAGFFDKLNAEDQAAEAPAAPQTEAAGAPVADVHEGDPATAPTVDSASSAGAPGLKQEAASADPIDEVIGEPLGAPQPFEPSDVSLTR